MCLMWMPLTILSAFELDKSWSIELSPEATSTEQYAAQELQHYIRKVSELDLPIMANASSPHVIRVGVRTRFKQLPPSPMRKNTDDVHDAFMIMTLKKDLYLTGTTPRAVLYAVYTFLTKQCGVHWLYPGASGEYLTKKGKIIFPELKETDSSPFLYRGLHLCGLHVDPITEEWMARNKINIMRSMIHHNRAFPRRQKLGIHLMLSDHNTKLPPSLMQKKPELFALYFNKRIPYQLCWSNPETREAVVNIFRKQLKAAPEIEILELFPEDNRHYCQCKKCSEIPHSERWFHFLNQVVGRLKQEFPAKKFGTIAYHSYKDTPQTEISSLDIVEYCPYERCFIHPLRQCPINEKVLHSVKKWQEKKAAIGIYGYEFDIFRPNLQIPCYSILDEQLKVFQHMGIKLVIPEAPAYNYPVSTPVEKKPWMRQRFGIYLYAKLLWNPSLDWKDVLTDYCNIMFGPAAVQMKEHYLAMDALWRSPEKDHLNTILIPPSQIAGKIFTPAVLQKENNRLLQTIQMVNNLPDSPEKRRFQKEMALEYHIFQQWYTTYYSAMAEKFRNTLFVPRAREKGTFDGAVTIPEFTTADSRPLPKTTARINYDDQALYLEILCRDPAMEQLVSRKRQHDHDTWKDECIELFFAIPNDPRGLYRHLIVNPSGSRYDAVIMGDGNQDLEWNPKWTAQIKKGSDFWKTVIRLPFREFETEPPTPGDEWFFTIKRSASAAGRKFGDSGFPDDRYHNISAFSLLKFARSNTSRTLLLCANHPPESFENIEKALRRDEWQISCAFNSRQIPEDLSNYDIILLRLPQLGLQQDFYRNQLLHAIQNGCIALISTYGNFPIDKYFGMPDLALQWSGWKVGKEKRTTILKNGIWCPQGSRFDSILRGGNAPSNAYTPLHSAAWEKLAARQLADGSDGYYLLSRKIGKGTLVITSSDAAFAGGPVILGNGWPEVLGMLLGGLYNAYHNN